ncbi:YraN family protein [Noviherbaspirillum aerium]|uniref:YraN family protein n=1 Tax=Noviherbaspirillum aerium TaxID=2588497 RepID=UPI00124E84CE|nr:YraN family protein [Noviherbaspirillum aerium]
MPLFKRVATRTSKQLEGDAGETRALAYLEQQGLSLLQRNFRCKGGEIDLIMKDNSVLVFVEVRKRAPGRFGDAAASVGHRKQARLTIAAQVYLQSLRTVPPCRFDVVAIDGERLNWIRNAIES